MLLSFGFAGERMHNPQADAAQNYGAEHVWQPARQKMRDRAATEHRASRNRKGDRGNPQIGQQGDAYARDSISDAYACVIKVIRCRNANYREPGGIHKCTLFYETVSFATDLMALPLSQVRRRRYSAEISRQLPLRI